MLVNRSSLPDSAAQQGLIVLRAYRCTEAKIQMHQSLQLAGSWGCRQHQHQAFQQAQRTCRFSGGRSEFPRNEKWCEPWQCHGTEGTGAQLWEVCVLVTGWGLMKPFCPSSLELCKRGERRQGLNVSSALGWVSCPALVLSWWEHLIRRAESSNEKSGSSCRWLGGIN